VRWRCRRRSCRGALVWEEGGREGGREEGREGGKEGGIGAKVVEVVLIITRRGVEGRREGGREGRVRR